MMTMRHNRLSRPDSEQQKLSKSAKTEVETGIDLQGAGIR
ncbi:hypothetical protein PSE_1353 [Pseudovibrio sp. FO-BEG1]|nr:hypothetical protein PSE_1353 [Pseudovibrio sp. FO-BEG1]EEA92064.1 hypothetical protein PJE062_1881 [Pseudovibrio sp. JE062]